MIPDSLKNVIVHQGFGAFSVYPCKLEIAQNILKSKLPCVPPSVAKAAQNIAEGNSKAVGPLHSRLLCKILAEVVQGPVGNKSAALETLLRRAKARGKPEDSKKRDSAEMDFTITQPMVDEVLRWSHAHHLSAHQFGNQWHAVLQACGDDWPHLSFLAPIKAELEQHQLKILPTEDLEMAEELSVLQRNKWKEGAEESRVVERIIEFVNQLCHRDERFSVARFEQAF